MLDISVQHSATVCRRSSEKLYRLSLKELNFEKLGLGFNGKISPYWNILKSCKLKDNYNREPFKTNLYRRILIDSSLARKHPCCSPVPATTFMHLHVLIPAHLVNNNRELKQRRRRRRGRRLVKNEFIFYKQNSRLFRSARYANGSTNEEATFHFVSKCATLLLNNSGILKAKKAPV